MSGRENRELKEKLKKAEDEVERQKRKIDQLKVDKTRNKKKANQARKAYEQAMKVVASMVVRSLTPSESKQEHVEMWSELKKERKEGKEKEGTVICKNVGGPSLRVRDPDVDGV